MKKSILTTAIICAFSFSSQLLAQNAENTGINGVSVELSGTFYQPNESQMIQESTPVLEFSGLNAQGGKDIVKGYINAFGKDVIGHIISDKLTEMDGKLSPAQRAEILSNKNKMEKEFPELIDFYSGVADASGFTTDEVYLTVWAMDGLFAMNIQDVASSGLLALQEAAGKTRGCTTIGWSNGVLGQNQDMPVSLAGYGAIWKSNGVIVHAPEPLFTSIVMGRDLATAVNTVDAFYAGGLEAGVPISGVLLAMATKFDNVMSAKETLDRLEVNAAYATSFADKKGQIITVVNKRGSNDVINGAVKGYVTHTNHPLGKEKALIDHYANGNASLFDYAVKTTIWRNEVAESHAKYSPEKSVTALKDIFKQKPLLKAPYEGNAFVTTNSIIHDLSAGCSYGTTWLPTMQEYTKVCFDEK
ncbi:hypothetical protein [Vibrio nomapromontoriensis]|uniref:hypothetical protein n=1 Tax=Vibrio nomapromontoriensis TaxID=2910246 RepID=UPI003D0D646D